jgi:hypothetical protein
MATTTNFAMTMDNADTSYPQDAGAARALTTNAGQNVGRYSNAGFENAKLQFPISVDAFNTPYIKFNFLDAYGKFITGSPTVSLRMPSVFNISNFSDYSRTEQIVGNAAGELNAYGSTGLAALASGAEATVINMAEALNYSFQKGVGGALGFAESAGLSGINQFEFSRRRAMNPMAQLLYKGPQYRKYQIPVPMKPRSQKEAQQIQKIIKVFRIASSPSYATSNDLAIDSAITTALSDTSFTFGYPHLIAFNIEFYEQSNSNLENATKKIIYKSKACAIESVAVDYGGQKLAFFEDGIPTEMNLTLQFSEVSARTLGDEMTSAKNPNFTIF